MFIEFGVVRGGNFSDFSYINTITEFSIVNVFQITEKNIYKNKSTDNNVVFTCFIIMHFQKYIKNISRFNFVHYSLMVGCVLKH